ncbi:helix-turn-helix domain-containing protein [Streptomyces ossamyceticus]|uniref:helix-turn-helix domain-containing protein n=1 Tax=Streptomyces ossamyceticus TaxID=249581 RepID=UPI003498BA67
MFGAQQRIDIAARLLADAVQTGRSVTDIAYAVGFKDASHFARAFKSRHCVSPREYRRDHSAAPQGPGA